MQDDQQGIEAEMIRQQQEHEQARQHMDQQLNEAQAELRRHEKVLADAQCWRLSQQALMSELLCVHF